MQGKFQLLRVRQFSEVINDSIAFAKNYIKPISYAILMVVVPIYVLGSFVYVNNISDAFNVGHTQNLFDFKRMVGVGLLGGLALIVGRILLTVIFISSFLQVEISETGELDSKEIFANMRNNFSRLIGFYLLAVLIAGIVIALIAIVFAALASEAATGPAILLMLLFFTGLAYLSVSLSFTPIIYMRERCSFGEAVSRSFYLVKNNWWWTFVILLIGGIIGGLAGYIFTIPYTFITTMRTFSSSHSGHTGFDVSILDRVALTFSNFGSIISTSVVTIVTFIQYYSLVEKKDGVNLMQKIDNIGTDQNSSY